jgi:hypothetical protein
MAITDNNEFAAREQLRASSAEFRKDVIEVTEAVYVAVGYSASNVTLIQGRDGSIIVDTSANQVDAHAIVGAFGDRMARPVRAIIYTHTRRDDGRFAAGSARSRRRCRPVHSLGRCSYSRVASRRQSGARCLPWLRPSLGVAVGRCP